MKRIFVLIMLLLLLTNMLWAGATSVNIAGKPTSDWFASGGTKDLGWRWMQEADELLAASGTNVGTGSVFYVDSGVSNAGDGTSWLNAVATLDEAVALCTDNAGDVIYVAQGHAETFIAANAADLDVIGITVIGLGTGSNRPTFTYTADGEMVIAAANVTIRNLVFSPGAANVTHAIEIEADADGSVIEFCEFTSGSTDAFEFVDAIQVTAAADDLIIRYNKATETTAGAVSWLDLSGGVVDNLAMYGNIIYGDYSTGAVDSTGRIQTLGYYGFNTITNLSSGDAAFYFNAAATGVMEYNRVFTDAEATAIDPGSMICFENYCATAINVSGMITPVYDDGTTQLNATTCTAIAAAVDALDGTGAISVCSTNVTTTTVIAAGLAGFGNDAFNEGWSLMCIYDTGGTVGTAPSGEIRDITDYVSTSGTFTVAAFTAALTAGDYVTLVPNYAIPASYNGSGSKIIYCDDGGSNGEGTTWQTAKTTLAAAEAIANAGDTILVGENHNENLNTGGVLINIAGVTVIGMGEGDSRPLFDCDADSDELTLDNAGITLKNLRFRPGATALTSCIRVEDAGIGCTIEDCAFVDGEVAATDEFVDAISVDTLASKLTVRNCTYYNTGTDGHTNTFVNLDEATIDSASIIGCTIYGDFAEAPIWGGAAVPTNVLVLDNVITNLNSGECCIEFAGAATGVIAGNKMASDTDGSVLDPGSARCYGNTQTLAINTGAELVPDGPVRDPKVHGTGKVFYVDASGSNGAGTTWATAKTTIDAAVNLCTANRGDFIYVAQGHTEDFTSEEADLDIDGITVIGLGEGTLKPTISYSNAAGTFSIDADNVTVKNLRFESSVTDVLIGVTIKSGSDYCTIADCDFIDEGDNVGTDEFLDAINIVTTCTGTTIDNCTFNAKAAGAETAIIMDDATDQTTIKNCIIRGDYSIGCIVADTAASTDILIFNNVIVNGSLVADGGLNAIEAINLVNDSAGLCARNIFAADVATGLAIRVADDVTFIDNWIADSDGDDKAGATESTSATITVFVDGG